MKKNRVLNSIVAILTVLSLIGGIFVGIDLMSTKEVANAATATVENILWNYAVEGGNATNVCTTQTGLSGEVKIPVEINGYPVVSIGKDTSNPCIPAGSSVTAVLVPNTITAIKDGAFKGSTGMKRFDFYEVESGELIAMENAPLRTIGASAFSGATSLEYLATPENLAIGDNAYSGCTKLKTIILSEGVATGKQSFKGCTAAINVTIGKNTTLGDNCFEGCTSITTIYVPQTTRLGNYAFKGCTGLKNLEVGIETIGNQFDNCYALENIVLDDTVKKVEYYAFNVTNTTAKKINDDTALVNYVKDGTLESNRGKSGLKTSTVTRNIYCKNPETVFGFSNSAKISNSDLTKFDSLKTVGGSSISSDGAKLIQEIYPNDTSTPVYRLITAPENFKQLNTLNKNQYFDYDYEEVDYMSPKKELFGARYLGYATSAISQYVENRAYYGNTCYEELYLTNILNYVNSSEYTKVTKINSDWYFETPEIKNTFKKIKTVYYDGYPCIESEYEDVSFRYRYTNNEVKNSTYQFTWNTDAHRKTDPNFSLADTYQQGRYVEGYWFTCKDSSGKLYEITPYNNASLFKSKDNGYLIKASKAEYKDGAISMQINSALTPYIGDERTGVNDIFDLTQSVSKPVTGYKINATSDITYKYKNLNSSSGTKEYVDIHANPYEITKMSGTLSSTSIFASNTLSGSINGVTFTQKYENTEYLYPNTASGQIAPVRIYTPKGSTATTTTQQTITNKDNSTTYVTAEKMNEALANTNFANMVNDYVQINKTIEKEDMPCYQPEGSIDYTLTKITAAYDGIAFEGREIDYDKVKITLRTDPAKKILDTVTASDPRVYIISPEDLNKVKIWKNGQNAYEAWPDKASEFPESTFDYDKFDFRIWQGFTHVLDDEDENSNVNCFPGMNTIYANEIPDGEMTAETKAYIFYVAGFKNIGKSARNMKLSDGTVMALSDYNDEYGTDYKEAPYKEDGTWVGFGGSYADENGSIYSQKDGEWAPIIYKCEVTIPTVPSTPNETYVATLNTSYINDNAAELGWNSEKQAFPVSDDAPLAVTKDMIRAQIIVDSTTRDLANSKFNIDKTQITSTSDNVITVTFDGEENALATVAIPVYNTDLEEITKSFEVENIKGLRNSVETLVEEYETACDDLTSYSNIVSAIEKQLTGGDLTAEEEAALTSTVAVSNEKITEIKAQITTLQSTLSEKLTALEEAETQVATLTATKTANEKRITELTAAVEEANGVVSGLKSDKQQLEATIQIDIATINSLTEKKGELETTISALNGDIEDMTGIIADMRATATSLQESIATLESNNSQLGEEVESLNNDITSLNTTIDNLENDVISKDQAITELNTTVTSLQGSIETLEAIKESNETEIKNLGDTVDSQNLEINLLTQKTAAAQEELENLKKENEAIGETLKDIVKDMSAGDTTVTAESIPEVIGELKAQIAELEQKSVNNIAQTTEEKLEKSGYKKTSMDETVNNLLNTIDSLKKSASTPSTPTVKTEYVYVDSGNSAEATKAKETVEKLTSENTTLQSTNTTLTNENAALTTKVNNLADQNDLLTENNEKLKEQKSTLTAEKKELNKEIKDLKKTNTALTNQLNEYKDKYSEAKDDVGALQKENKKLGDELSKIKATNTGSTGNSGSSGGATNTSKPNVEPVEPVDPAEDSDGSDKVDDEDPSTEESSGDSGIYVDPYDAYTLPSIPSTEVVLTVFEPGVDYAHNVNYITPENPILSELQQEDIEAVNATLSYYANNKGILSSLINSNEKLVEDLTKPATSVNFEAITGARIKTNDSVSETGKKKVTIESDEFIKDNSYMIVHHSEERGVYDIVTLTAQNNKQIAFELDDFSPITVSKIVVDEIEVSPVNPNPEPDLNPDPEPNLVGSEEENSGSNSGIIILIVIGVAVIAFVVFLILSKKGGAPKEKTKKTSKKNDDLDIEEYEEFNQSEVSDGEKNSEPSIENDDSEDC